MSALIASHVAGCKRRCGKGCDAKRVFNVRTLFEEAVECEQKGLLLVCLGMIRHLVTTCAEKNHVTTEDVASSLLNFAQKHSVVEFSLLHFLNSQDRSPVIREMYSVTTNTRVSSLSTALLQVSQFKRRIPEINEVDEGILLKAIGKNGKTQTHPAARILHSAVGKISNDDFYAMYERNHVAEDR